MASSGFPSVVTGVTVETATNGALSGDGSSGNKLAVGVDGVTVEVNGSNQLQVKAGSVAPVDASYVTADDETGVLTGSRQLTAGANIAFDVTTPGVLEISATGGGNPFDQDLNTTDDVTFASVAVGSGAAQSGSVRLALEAFVKARNIAGDGDVPLIGLSNTIGLADTVVIGPSSGGIGLVSIGTGIVSSSSTIETVVPGDFTVGFVVLGDSNFITNTDPFSGLNVLGNGNQIAIFGTDVEDVYVFGEDNLVATDTFVAYAVGEDNTLGNQGGGGEDSASWMFAYGEANTLNASNGQRLFAFGRSNNLAHSHTFAFGRALTTTGQNQTWLGATVGDTFIATGGNVIVQTLPTADPMVAGALWADSLAVKVSAG